jgi:predicted DNA-binding protein
MFVRAKRQVQKSFRVNDEIERDLCILAKLTGKSQNDIVNATLEETLKDNKIYFLRVAALEHFQSEIESAGEDSNIKPFELGGLRIEFEYAEDYKVKLHTTVTRDGEVIDEGDFEFESDICEEFENYLEESCSSLIDLDAEDTKKYLNDRVDYDDYAKVRGRK